MTELEVASKELLPVIIIGDAFVDIVCHCAHGMPVLGGDALLQSPVQSFPGGSAVNTATHLASLLRMTKSTSNEGGNLDLVRQVQLFTAFGDDSYGVLLQQHAREHNFDMTNCAPVVDDKVSGETAHCVAIVANGDRSFLSHRGCMELYVCEGLCSKVFRNIPNRVKPQSQYIHISGYYNIPNFWYGKLTDQLIQMKDQNRKNNIRTVVSLVPQYDASGKWDGGIIDTVKSCNIDFFIMNETEAYAITKRSTLDEVAEFLGTTLPQTYAVVTQGRQGAVVFYQGKQIMSQSTITVNVVDTTGAGDAFVAGFMDGFLTILDQIEKEDIYHDMFLKGISEGLKRGCAVGTANVMTLGASNPPPKSLIEHCTYS